MSSSDNSDTSNVSITSSVDDSRGVASSDHHSRSSHYRLNDNRRSHHRFNDDSGWSHNGYRLNNNHRRSHNWLNNYDRGSHDWRSLNHDHRRGSVDWLDDSGSGSDWLDNLLLSLHNYCLRLGRIGHLLTSSSSCDLLSDYFNHVLSFEQELSNQFAVMHNRQLKGMREGTYPFEGTVVVTESAELDHAVTNLES